MSTDFIARWSRRKRGVDPEQATEPTPPAPVGDPGALLDAEAPSESDGAVHPAAVAFDASGEPAPLELTAEELAALPDPEVLTAASDITGFLRGGVPAALRNRALRRMWSIDPAIRDAIGDARDYAWDWNVPGGMPVSGPISSSIDIDKMVRGIFGSDKAEPEAAAETALEPRSPPIPEDERQPASTRDETPVAQASGVCEPALPETERAIAELDQATAGAAEGSCEPIVQRRPLQHGGALPA